MSALKCLPITLAAILALPLFAASDAEKEKEEAAQWEKEAAADAALEENKEGSTRILEGTVVLTVDKLTTEQKSALTSVNVGTFSDVKGGAYILRLEQFYLLDWLKQNAKGQKVILHGKLRVNGKYFVAFNADLVNTGGPAAPPIRRKRGGM